MIRFCFLFLLPFQLWAQVSPKTLIHGVTRRFDQVKSYSASLQMQFQIPGVQMEPITAKVYYKKPSRFRIQAKGILFMPKQNPYYALQLLRDTAAYTALFAGVERIGNIPMQVIQIIPLQSGSDLILGKFWIEESRQLIHKAQLTTQSSGTLTMEQTYGKQAGLGLPDGIRFLIDVARFKIPKAVAMEINAKARRNEKAPPQRGIGQITLSFSGFRLNETLDDKVFEEEVK